MPWNWSCSGDRQKAAFTAKNHLDRKTWLMEHRDENKTYIHEMKKEHEENTM
jgi:hypothetical protein